MVALHTVIIFSLNVLEVVVCDCCRKKSL